MDPEPLVSTITVRQRFRYLKTLSASAATVTNIELLNVLNMATSASVTAGLFQGVRIVEVEIWGTTGGASNTYPYVALDWKNASSSSVVGAPSVYVEDISMGTSRPGHVCMAPPPESLAALWQNVNLAIAGTSIDLISFFASVNTSCVVDIVLDCIVADGTPTLAGSSSGLTAGLVYSEPLAAGALAPWDYLDS
jgi:hypothetical protein